MLLKNNNLNKVIENLSYNFKFEKYFSNVTNYCYKINFLNNFNKNSSIFNKVSVKNNYIKVIYPLKYNKNKIFKFKKIINKLKKLILKINRTSLTLKSNRIYRYKLITCIGSCNKWVGIGEGKNKLFKKSFTHSINSAKKHIYNIVFNCNDYKESKYKGCKFKVLNMGENKKNLRIYDNITKLSGDKKIKLISYSSKTTINVLKYILNNCN